MTLKYEIWNVRDKNVCVKGLYLRKRIVDKRMKRMKILNIKNMVDLKRCIEPIKSLLERKYVQYKIVLFFFFFFFMSNLNQNFILFLNSTNWNFQSRTILRYLPHAQPVYTVHLNIQAGPTFEVWIVPPIFISQSDRPVVWLWKDFEFIFFYVPSRMLQLSEFVWTMDTTFLGMNRFLQFSP